MGTVADRHVPNDQLPLEKFQGLERAVFDQVERLLAVLLFARKAELCRDSTHELGKLQTSMANLHVLLYICQSNTI
jgi:hypothetical protein